VNESKCGNSQPYDVELMDHRIFKSEFLKFQLADKARGVGAVPLGPEDRGMRVC
jgi:hypothetical protein